MSTTDDDLDKFAIFLASFAVMNLILAHLSPFKRLRAHMLRSGSVCQALLSAWTLHDFLGLLWSMRWLWLASSEFGKIWTRRFWFWSCDSVDRFRLNVDYLIPDTVFRKIDCQTTVIYKTNSFPADSVISIFLFGSFSFLFLIHQHADTSIIRKSNKKCLIYLINFLFLKHLSWSYMLFLWKKHWSTIWLILMASGMISGLSGNLS